MEPYSYTAAKMRFVNLARSFGIGALVSAIFFSTIPFIPAGFGFLAILFAFLSKGYEPKLDKLAKSGIYCGLAAIIISVGIFAVAYLRLATDTEYRANTINAITEMYGDIYEDAGINIEDLLNSYLPEAK